MQGDFNIEGIYNWLQELKEVHRVSYSRMGEMLGYSGPGVKKAIQNKTLSISQIKKIALESGQLENFNKLIETKEEVLNSEDPVQHSIEDIIAQKVFEKLIPLLTGSQENHRRVMENQDKLVEAISHILLKADANDDQVEDIKNQLQLIEEQMNEITGMH
jgi:hypothetical protein